MKSQFRLVPAAWAKSTAQKGHEAGRDVAIKVLSDTFTQDPERMARFEREARVLASFEPS